jgi:hypothetical protein
MITLILDFDGVLNPDEHEYLLYRRFHSDKSIKITDEFGILFDDRCVRWLNWIVYRTNCKIVVSSSWRSDGLNKLQLMWEMRDLPGEIIDITPYDYQQELEHLYPSELDNAVRGYQIQEWLDNNQPDKYCIVDDMVDMLPHQKFVKTNKRIGLDYITSKKIIEILNN